LSFAIDGQGRVVAGADVGSDRGGHVIVRLDPDLGTAETLFDSLRFPKIVGLNSNDNLYTGP
jgi:hypothetical protein